MSRSSKGYADFFPAAPKVLQRKRSRAAESRHGLDPTTTGSASPLRHSTASISSAKGEAERERHRKPGLTGDSHSAPSLTFQEEGDCTQGDLLNGVGSASSTSTASSIFSTGHRLQSLTNQHGSHRSSSVTPLTHVDASPSRDVMNSPQRKHLPSEKGSAAHMNGASTLEKRGKSDESSYSDRGQLPRPPQARPSKGEIKGEKIRYDPDLDKRISSKEKRSRKPEYVAFGEKVRLHRLRQAVGF